MTAMVSEPADATIPWESVEGLAQQFGPEFYLFYPSRFLANLRRFRAELQIRYPRSILAYAYKANYLPVLGDTLATEGCWAEVSSGLELEIAGLNVPPDRIIFNGPVKREGELRSAMAQGSLVHLESRHELAVAAAVASRLHKQVDIGLRVSFPLDGYRTRFGFDADGTDFADALDTIARSPPLRLASLHSHFSTRERSLALFEHRVKRMLTLYDRVAHLGTVRYLDVGGGFFGPGTERPCDDTPEWPSFAEYAEVLAGGFRDHFAHREGPHLVVEPGVSLVADAMDLVARVVDIRTVQGRRIAVIDTSSTVLFSTGARFEPSISVARRSSTAESGPFEVVGYTCMEHDVLLRDLEIPLAIGDFLVFHHRGAYSLVFKPPFIRGAPPVIGLDGSVYRRAERSTDILATYAWSGHVPH